MLSTTLRGSPIFFESAACAAAAPAIGLVLLLALVLAPREGWAGGETGTATVTVTVTANPDGIIRRNSDLFSLILTGRVIPLSPQTAQRCTAMSRRLWRSRATACRRASLYNFSPDRS
jgi:hypothetical protein